MRKNIFSLLLCLAALTIPTNSFADVEAPAGYTDGPTWYDYREPITEGQGSMTDPIRISTPGQLAQLAYNVNTGAETYTGKVVALAADINLTKEVDGKRVQWVPIGNDATNYFRGLFVGIDLKDYAANGFKTEQKHKISGVYINVKAPDGPGNFHFGLFGFLGGNASHLQLENVSISVDATGNENLQSLFVGGLCGNTIDQDTPYDGSDLWFRGRFHEINGDYGHYINFAIDDVTVKGSIDATGDTKSEVAVGGICGRVGNMGIIHCASEMTINATDCKYVGGICGIECGMNPNNEEGNTLYDCIANTDITFSGIWNDQSIQIVYVGGIVGNMEAGQRAYACVSMGSIKCLNTERNLLKNFYVGGICGELQPMAGIYACGSTMLIKSFGVIGGIVGLMMNGTEDTNKHSKVECCSFSGHLDGSYSIVDEKGQTTGSASTTDNFLNYAGGICGQSLWNQDDRLERITRCLMLGTIANENYASSRLPSAVVGIVGSDMNNPQGSYLYPSVTYCYFDSRMFNGYAIPNSYDGGQSVKGLTTEDLTSGKIEKVAWLNASDTEPDAYGYRVEKGYYPIFYENKGREHSTYYAYPDNHDYNNTNLSRLYYYYNVPESGKVNMYSTVYVSGALLCATPVSFVKGDCPNDFVSTMSAPTKTYNWDEKETGRSVIMTCETFFPETDVIKVKDKTATAFNNGTCYVTTTALIRKKLPTYNRPAIMGGTKYIGLNSTIDREWDGTEATKFADGTGTAADPYIIKNAAQLYHAIKTNQTGEFYKQLCNIIITKSTGNNTLITESCLAPAKPNRNVTTDWATSACDWNANYNGNGHSISGLYLVDHYYDQAPTGGQDPAFFSLFGNVDAYGSINNLAVVDAWIAPEPSVVNGRNNNEELNTYYGIIAGKVLGSITNCIAQGISTVGRPCGGICAYVSGTVEDCISAVIPLGATPDLFTPFVANASNITSREGSVTNCLSVTPNIFSSADKSTSNLKAMKNCYWLKGYEPGNTGQTLDEIGAALGNKDRWTWSRNYFPTLKTFAETDIAKLMMVPVRTDKGYEFDESTQTANNYLFGFTKMLEFEPGAATWTNVHSTHYMEADSELGIIAPASSMEKTTAYGMISPVEAIYASLGKSFYCIPMRTSSGDIQRGITFVDPHAERACVLAFDSKTGDEKDGRLSLAELSAITTEQTLTAFKEADVQLEAQQIKQFPEFRFFKAVTNLTTQLSGLNNLEEVRLPYNLQTISGDPNLSGNGTRPFSMTQIKDLTLPGKVTNIEPGAFAGSEIENILVDPFNTKFVSRDGILYNSGGALVAFPNARIASEIIIPGVIEEIKPGAVYDQSGILQKVFFDTTDYSTVADLGDNGFFIIDRSIPDVYISDATYGSVLFNEYLDDESWEDYAEDDKLHCYYPLKIGSAKAGTMYIGFDTELPDGLKAYIVTSDSKDEQLAYLKKVSNQIPNRSPIVVFADEAATYRLFPLEESLEPWKMYTNKLNGVGRDGMEVYQSDADRGSILTLGRNNVGTLGFFYYKGTAPLSPYRAYLTYEWVTNNSKLFFSFLDDEATSIETVGSTTTDNIPSGDNAIYDLHGRKVTTPNLTFPSGRDGVVALPKGIYIYKGKKIVVK